jgi:hypothetical protein
VATAMAEYYKPGKPAAFSTLQKLQAALKQSSKKTPSQIKKWLEEQDAHTLHRPVRKRFPRNPYNITNLMALWESDLVDVQILVSLTTMLNTI